MRLSDDIMDPWASLGGSGAGTSGAISPPSAFGWSPNFSVYYDRGSGTFKSTLDYESLRPSGTAVYVDIATGNDGNTGADWANALKGIRVALDKLAADSSKKVVYVKTGDYTMNYRWDNQAGITQDVAFIAVDGPVTTGRYSGAIYWRRHDVLPNTWKASRGSYAIISAVDLSAGALGAQGNGTVLPNAGSIAGVEASPGSYYDDGSDVYVRTFDSRAPDADLRTHNNRAGPAFNNAGQTIYIEGFIFEGQKLNIQQAGTLVLVDTKVLYAASGVGLDIDGVTGTAYLIRCEGSENPSDGINYNGCPRIYEDTCTGSGAGQTTGTTENGSTSHGGASVIRMNCTYQRCYGPVVADVGAAKTWNLGCTWRNSVAASNDYNFYSEGDVWNDTCTSVLDASTYDYGGATADILQYNSTDEGQYNVNSIGTYVR